MANQSTGGSQDRSAAPLLVLVGFMGAGKSMLGALLARELACPVVDLDAEIASLHGPIPQLFAERGESGFRAIEHYQLECTLDAIARPAVLALGGGAFVQPANRELLQRAAAAVVFLDAPFEVLYSRIAHTAAERPLAADAERLRTLYEQRRSSYLLAGHSVDASGSDPASVLAKLLRIARELGAHTPAGVTLKQPR